MKLLTDRYQADLLGVLSCYDRMIITGTLPGACYAGGMTSFLNSRHIKIFDYAKVFADPWRERIRQCAHELADKHGIAIEHVNKPHIRKEDLIAKVIAQRGEHPGLVHILSAMEACSAYKPWHDKNSHKTFLRPTSGKCLHYYFYFIDEEVGLCYLRVPTWCPFRLQFYCNGHSWLETKLAANGIGYAMADNAFIRIDDFARAQSLADQLKPDDLHRILDRYAKMCCPVQEVFGQQYHWSLMQTEYSTDLTFRSDTVLSTLYGDISRQAVIAVKAEQVSSFLGKKVTPQLAQELGTRLSTRIEGTCIKHHMGSASIKIYDKFGRVLRIETTTNDVSFFKHHRKVEHRDGTSDYRVADLKKSIFSLGDLAGLMRAGCARYLEFVGELEDRSGGQTNLEQISRPVKDERERSWRGFNFFLGHDLTVLLGIMRGEYQISGMSNRRMPAVLPGKNSGQIGRILKRLRLHGLIKKVGKTYKYYLTELGRRAVLVGLKLKEHLIVPGLATASA